jgi:hypothetical protein
MKKFTSINVEINDRKESEEGRMLIQNKCVSSQKGRIKKRRGRCGRLVGHFTLPFLSWLCVVSSGRRAVNRDKSKPSGNTHKIPQMSQLRNADFQTSTDWLSNTDEQLNKDAE